MRPIHFDSGITHPGEADALDHAGVDICVAFPRLSLRLAARLWRLERSRVFVDSGAFSEVTFGAEGRQVVHALGPDHWAAYFGAVQTLTLRLGAGRVWFATPDAVGCQIDTLARARAWASDVEACRDLGAVAVAPVQRGALARADFAHRLEALHGADIWGIPSNKAATPPAELAAFLAAFPGRPVHFLGAGRGYLASVAHLLDGRQISHDTCRIRAWVGRTNGRSGGRRPLTAAQDDARASGLHGRAMKRCALTAVLEQLG